MPNPRVISPPAISVAREMPNNVEFALFWSTRSDPWANAEQAMTERRTRVVAILRSDLLIRFLPFGSGCRRVRQTAIPRLEGFSPPLPERPVVKVCEA